MTFITERKDAGYSRCELEAPCATGLGGLTGDTEGATWAPAPPSGLRMRVTTRAAPSDRDIKVKES